MKIIQRFPFNNGFIVINFNAIKENREEKSVFNR